MSRAAHAAHAAYDVACDLWQAIHNGLDWLAEAIVDGVAVTVALLVLGVMLAAVLAPLLLLAAVVFD